MIQRATTRTAPKPPYLRRRTSQSAMSRIIRSQVAVVVAVASRHLGLAFFNQRRYKPLPSPGMPEVQPGPTRSLCGSRGPLWGILGGNTGTDGTFTLPTPGRVERPRRAAEEGRVSLKEGK